MKRTDPVSGVRESASAGGGIADEKSADVLPGTNDGSHLRALSFTIDRRGIHLAASVVAAGRVKAPPRSVAADRLEFDVLDESGAVIYAGSIDHPLHVVYEYEDPAQPGTLRRRPRDLEEESFQVRLPAELKAVQIAFYEVRGNSGGPLRTPLGTLALR